MSIELSRHLESLGHSCDSFSLDDCGLKPNRLTVPFIDAFFQRRLLSFVRKNGRQYDAIQVEHNLLPFPREAYRYPGVLIAKSNGLAHFYDDYKQEIERKLLAQARQSGTLSGRVLRRLGTISAGGRRAVGRTFAAADRIHLPNHDEFTFVRDRLGHGSKCVLAPLGISEERAAELASARTPESRSSCRTIVFVGTWSIRKGRLAFPGIVRTVRTERPDIQFRLLGTGSDRDTILGAFASEDREHVEVVESFAPDELPGLLADAACGMFPSYVEGFGLGVLEMLAAGIPVVAWDIPGPKDMLANIHGMLVPKGDANAISRRILEILALPSAEHAELCEQSLKASRIFRWSVTADQFVSDLAL